MDVLDRSVVHAAAAPCFGVQCTLKNRAENCGADLAPIKVFARAAQKDVHDLIVELRDLDVLVRKQAAVYIWERSQDVVKIGISILGLCVEHFEKIYDRATGIPHRKTLEIVVELHLLPEKPAVLCIKTENQPHAQHIQAL